MMKIGAFSVTGVSALNMMVGTQQHETGPQAQLTKEELVKQQEAELEKLLDDHLAEKGATQEAKAEESQKTFEIVDIQQNEETQTSEIAMKETDADGTVHEIIEKAHVNEDGSMDIETTRDGETTTEHKTKEEVDQEVAVVAQAVMAEAMKMQTIMDMFMPPVMMEMFIFELPKGEFEEPVGRVGEAEKSTVQIEELTDETKPEDQPEAEVDADSEVDAQVD